jgi:2-methylcitrate dehydratase PrpD
MTSPRDLVHELAEFAAGIRCEDLSADAREAAKESLLDILWVSLAASGLEPAARLGR